MDTLRIKRAISFVEAKEVIPKKKIHQAKQKQNKKKARFRGALASIRIIVEPMIRRKIDIIVKTLIVM